jgi:hypothetical protein
MIITGGCGHPISDFRQGGVSLDTDRVTQTRASVTSLMLFRLGSFARAAHRKWLGCGASKRALRQRRARQGKLPSRFHFNIKATLAFAIALCLNTRIKMGCAQNWKVCPWNVRCCGQH